jgi:FtsZ-interacting cell division protein ZipA
MNIQIIVIIVAVIAIIALLVSRTGGPRVTHIDRTIRKNKEDGE